MPGLTGGKALRSLSEMADVGDHEHPQREIPVVYVRKGTFDRRLLLAQRGNKLRGRRVRK